MAKLAKAQELPRVKKGDVVALDLETKDPHLELHGPGWCYHDGGYIVGVALAWEGGSGYWPVRHAGGDNVAEAPVRRWVRDAVKKGVRFVFHNAIYDRGWLTTWDIEEDDWHRGAYDDTLTMAALQWEYRRSYGLDGLAKEFGLEEKQGTLLEEYAKAQGWKGKAGNHIWRMPGSVVAPYATPDARITYNLRTKLWNVMQAEGWQAAYRKEMDLHDVLIAMRARGVRVDLDAVAQAEVELKRQVAKAKEFLGPININSALEIAAVCDRLGIKYPYTAKTNKPSFRAEWMKEQTHEFFTHLLSARTAGKADGTFIQGLLKHVKDGRVHAQFHPLRSDEGGAATGRFSSTDPNLQNQPAKLKWLKRLIRGLFLPEEGQQWAALDYSQQEPRLAVHYAVKVGVRGGRATAERYKANPWIDFHQMVADMASILRDPAKTTNLAIMYGQGEASTCKKLGFETVLEEDERIPGKFWERAGPEGKAFLEKYHANVPFVSGLDRECRRLAKQRGWIKTLNGRRCRFQTQDGTKPMVAYPYQALNRLVQGSAADQTKAAMIALHRAGYHLMVTVHDEVGCSVGDLSEARAAAKLMEECVELEVPSVVDVEIGRSWGEAELPDEDND